MKGIKKVFKLLGIAVAVIIMTVVIIAAFFLNLSPQFGGSPSEVQKEQYAKSEHYREGKFINQIPTTLDLGFVKTTGVIYDYFFNQVPDLEPSTPIPVEKVDSLEIIRKPHDLKRLTWFGHSACLLEMESKKILFDPMLGESPSPHPLLGPKRYSKELPIPIEKLPYIDAVVISHDHYDHLDYESIIKLKDKVGHFYVALGVGAHLIEWGINPEKITELDWWKESSADGFTFICTPARHFSGRGLSNNFTTLWASWIVKTENSSVYFSGDSGYGPHFKEIGNRYGPFDFVMLECGQYNELWKDIHMMPEQTVQAAIDLKGKLMMPIHWGAFTLAMHTWIDPINRVTVSAHERLVPITTPKIGEPVILQQPQFPHSEWWK
jgi:L-ascorbate metabolism protein UlaG (beta-lactamase superfamily)